MDLAELRQIADAEIAAQEQLIRVRCCTAAGCMSSGSGAVRDALIKAVADRFPPESRGGLNGIHIAPVGCMKLCCEGPLVQVDSAGILYERVSAADAPAIIQAAAEGKTASRLKLGDPNSQFFTNQHAIVLENSGVIEPERIESYLATGGYRALHQALDEMTPSSVIEEITRSGLRGRGGAGYPTGLKWAQVAKQPPGRKFVICNADEGDPGAFMDRSVLESDPHRVLEGMAVAAYAVGADQGYIYVRGEYPLAIHRLQTAIRQARRLGILGGPVFGTSFNFRVDLRIGAGAFVCGEETALIASIEGQRGLPRPRPPYPAQSGLWGAPTLINNVETFANIAPIIKKGSAWYSSIGTGKSKGTKVFALAGKVVNTGLVEVPMGTTLRTIVETMGGGAPNGRPIKAVQTGGPSGGCIPADKLDTPVDYESLAALGSIMGSGGMIVMDDSDNMVEVAKYFMEFCADESCGKCIPCRAGTVQMHALLGRISDGGATPADVQQLETLCDLVKHTSLCGLGQSAPNPVLSTLRYFRDEYTALLKTDVDGRVKLPVV